MPSIEYVVVKYTNVVLRRDIVSLIQECPDKEVLL